MTEAEWQTCDDPQEMLDLLLDKGRERKLRLFACACHRDALRFWLQTEANFTTFVDWVRATERYADELAAFAEWKVACTRLQATGYSSKDLAVRYEDARAQTVDAADFSAEYAGWHGGADYAESQHADQFRREALFLRDIFGNPFRPVTFSPEWRTNTALALARQMYESRDFSVMPILADALQDAGCDNEDILSHCRDIKHPHVPACRVVDLVLDKK